ncbi:MAG: hypothetical protein V4506_08945 [Bacteroidota bacterium]
MKIKFNLQKRDGTFFSETDPEADLQKYKEEIRDKSVLSCSLSISVSGADWIIHDELGPLINNFCFQVPLDLLRTSAAEYHFFEVFGKVDLQRIDESVLISGAFVQDIKVPFLKFIFEALHCGFRCIDFLEQFDNKSLNNDRLLLMESASRVKAYLLQQHPEFLDSKADN